MELDWLRAILTGDPAAAADGVAGAFLSGYRAALARLIPNLPAGRAVCLCATESAGAHPRAIATRLEPDGDGFRVTGRKQWVTGGPLADLLLVVASTGVDATGKNRLRLVQVDARAPGVTIEPMPPTPFVPEIPHAQVALDRVRVAADALLPGDGYDRYLKPFRTVEDIHVHAAVLAFLLAAAVRRDLPRPLRDELAAALVLARALAGAAPLAAETHVALAGALAQAQRLAAQVRAALPAEDSLGPLLDRDLPLLQVAGKARAARIEAAWAALSETHHSG
jgi:alkylation response protein AidB-like acyl-CoA dehydrogenase